MASETPFGTLSGASEQWVAEISDGTKTFKLYVNNVEWPLNTDNFVVIYFDATMVPLEFLEALDEWEANGTTLNVSVTAFCTFPQGSIECPPDSKLDYDSFEGTAVIQDPREKTEVDGETHYGGWKYNPQGLSAIPLVFSQIE